MILTVDRPATPPKHDIPNCFGAFVCLDDCVVSCAYWEECKQENENPDDDEFGYDGV